MTLVSAISSFTIEFTDLNIFRILLKLLPMEAMNSKIKITNYFSNVWHSWMFITFLPFLSSQHEFTRVFTEHSIVSHEGSHSQVYCQRWVGQVHSITFSNTLNNKICRATSPLPHIRTMPKFAHYYTHISTYTHCTVFGHFIYTLSSHHLGQKKCEQEWLQERNFHFKVCSKFH